MSDELKAMIGSTALDLTEHRREVVEACLRVGVFPSGMEQLPARDATDAFVQRGNRDTNPTT